MTRSRVLVPVGLLVSVFVAFLPTLSNGFTNWDDQKNFLENYGYRGLSSANLQWMWSSFLLGHWHPITWMTLGLDYVLWGMNPLGYHLTSLLVHAASAVLLYEVLRLLLKLAGKEPSPTAAAVGALFYAIHPLRVESVAWITERRDVMCGLFVLISVLAYLKHVDEERQGRSGTRWLALSIAAFGGSLLSKALGILLPAVLFLLDVYPLGRFTPGARKKVLLEKLPFLLLSFADAGMMILAMKHIQAVRPVGSYNLLERAAQAAYGLCFYPLKTIWPVGLIPLYRIDKPLNPWALKYVLSMAAVLVGGIGLFLQRRRCPWALVAVLSYAILVFPVLGVAVTGMQIAADRYTYLCLLPASVLVAAGLDRAEPKRIWTAAAGVLVVVLGVLTYLQTGVWKDSITLWTHQLRYDPDCDLAYNSRGAARQDRGDLAGAVEDCTKSIRLDPTIPDPYLNRGLSLAKQGDLRGALSDFDQVIRLNPARADAYTNRGITRIRAGDPEGALADLTEALSREGQKAEVYAARGSVRASRGDLKGAVEDFESALKWAPPGWPPRADVERKLIRARQMR